MNKLVFSLSVFALSLSFVSCDTEKLEEKAKNNEDAVEALQEYVMVSKMFQDASNSSEESIIKSEGLKSTMDGPTITIDPLGFTWPKTITVDYGSDGVTGVDGVLRQGKLIIVSTRPYKEEESVHTTTFENYYQNGNRIEGIHTTTNIGQVDGLHTFNVEIKDGKVTTPEGKVVYYTQNTTRTWLTGDDTPLYIWDDEYKIVGVQSGVSSKGVDYSLEITDPLHVVVHPREIKSGVLNVAIDGLQDIIIDYEARTITIGLLEFPLDKQN